MTRHAPYILLSALTLGVYLVMVLWSLPAISAAAGGLPPFDLRPMGYDTTEARAFLEALTPEGRALYAGWQHRLDAVFPAALAIWSCWTLLKLLPRRLALVLCALALVASGADYAENAAVARLLEGFDPDTALAASRWTVIKSMASTVVYTAMLAGLLHKGWRALRG